MKALCAWLRIPVPMWWALLAFASVPIIDWTIQRFPSPVVRGGLYALGLVIIVWSIVVVGGREAERERRRKES